MPVIKGGEGAGFRLKQGQSFSIINTHGSQVVDLFAHNAADVGEAPYWFVRPIFPSALDFEIAKAQIDVELRRMAPILPMLLT